ncbi:MAG TPA: 3-hydroxyacyl-CoA dehydrogenase NAD-binding domain-containing protein [Terriglobales bacterium]|nr:3-hydroxyacyl-CoA dehydrogenase NAD-binding domain-containing protein [Terriglobales bacterium]
MKHPPSKVAVVGAGAMGTGITQVAVAAGHAVQLFDARAGAAQTAIASVGSMLQKLAAKRKITAADADAACARMSAATDLASLAGAGVVIEAVVEDLGVKRDLWMQVESLVSVDCLLATNTSSLGIPSIASALKVPGRLVGMHFFNPAPLMELVEIVGGITTDAAPLDRAEALARSWGKTTVRARSTPGFIVNRVARPYYAEGMRLLDEGVASAATLDAIYRECGGFRMGPMELTDLIGHDVNFAVTSTVWRSFFNDPRFTPSLLQQELVEAGWLGRKSGRGFYDYNAGAATLAPASLPPHARPERLALGGMPDALRQRVEAAGIAVANGPAAVEFDLAFDYAAAKRMAISRSRECDDATWQAVVGALQASGLAVSELPPLPGLVVMRTVAMLANEAADAVYHGVASAADVDMAMCKGVNYPIGPLAWADRVGIGVIFDTLSRLGAFYGEDRYRISPLLRRLHERKGRFHG